MKIICGKLINENNFANHDRETFQTIQITQTIQIIHISNIQLGRLASILINMSDPPLYFSQLMNLYQLVQNKQDLQNNLTKLSLSRSNNMTIRSNQNINQHGFHHNIS
ncbi:hypothetical protein DERF_008958 [Dermatophagoides farinae]|uniref:Uncharacterized protein n=1 Tax=Dermatophagoides farinae TaxID=6954 RepID=A0A922HWB5_DERFA|nr:hypothetical protein DERF_008958 [Dermatophagoides farinae]